MNINNLSVKARVRIHRPPAEVFNAFADASSMSKFWFTRRDDGLKEGSLFRGLSVVARMRFHLICV